MLAAWSILASAVAPAPPVAIPGSWFEVEPGVRLHYSIEGAGSRWLLVPIGRLVGDLGALADSHRIVRYDPRGRGRSTAWADSMEVGIELDLADLDALRRHLGIERADLLGISYYGALVALYAARHPDAVGRIVMAGPMAPTAEQFATRAAATDSRTPTEAQREYERLRDQGVGKTDPERLCRAYVRSMMPDLYANPGTVEPSYEACELPNERPDAIAKWAAALFGSAGAWDFRAQAGRVRAPALVVQGSADRITPPAGAETWTEILPAAELVRLPDVGHLPLRERPEEALDAIVDFLSGD